MNLKRIESLGRDLRVRDLRVRDLKESIQDRGASRYSDLAAISGPLLLGLGALAAGEVEADGRGLGKFA